MTVYPHAQLDAASLERFIPSRFLEGPLPTVLVAGYHFYFEEPEVARADSKVMLRGYPARPTPPTSNHDHP